MKIDRILSLASIIASIANVLLLVLSFILMSHHWFNKDLNNLVLLSGIGVALSIIAVLSFFLTHRKYSERKAISLLGFFLGMFTLLLWILFWIIVRSTTIILL